MRPTWENKSWKISLQAYRCQGNFKLEIRCARFVCYNHTQDFKMNSTYCDRFSLSLLSKIKREIWIIISQTLIRLFFADNDWVIFTKNMAHVGMAACDMTERVTEWKMTYNKSLVEIISMINLHNPSLKGRQVSKYFVYFDHFFKKNNLFGRTSFDIIETVTI